MYAHPTPKVFGMARQHALLLCSCNSLPKHLLAASSEEEINMQTCSEKASMLRLYFTIHRPIMLACFLVKYALALGGFWVSFKG